MLIELNVKNLALAEDVSLLLGSGLNVLTGETGAGKSIIVGALSLLLGAKATADLVRNGCDTALVEGVWDIHAQNPVIAALEQMGLDDDSDTDLIISREIHKSGKARCRINGRTVSATQLKELAPLLVDICGQHENQSLFSSSKQLELLDKLGGTELWSNRLKLGESYGILHSLISKRDALALNTKETLRRVDLINHQISEIDDSGVLAMNEEDLRKDRNMLLNADKLITEANKAYDFLTEEHSSEGSVLDGISRALKSLDNIIKLDPSLERINNQLTSALESVNDASRAIRHYIGSIDHNPERLEEVETALDKLSRLKRKYGDSLDEIKAYRLSIQEELDALNTSEEQILILDKDIAGTLGVYAKIASQLTALRHIACQRISQQVNKELGDLGMPEAEFNIDLIDHNKSLSQVDGAPGPTGMEYAEFSLAANPGEESKPIVKVASGGELSRVLLALKSVMGKYDDIPTMVFDEIDAGIGGKTGTSVGTKLSSIGKDRQVLCVTHLSQIACMADKHFVIQKLVVDGRTKTTVTDLADDNRIHELARMLGSDSTERTLGHVREMLDNASMIKQKMIPA